MTLKLFYAESHDFIWMSDGGDLGQLYSNYPRIMPNYVMLCKAHIYHQWHSHSMVTWYDDIWNIVEWPLDESEGSATFPIWKASCKINLNYCPKPINHG